MKSVVSRFIEVAKENPQAMAVTRLVDDVWESVTYEHVLLEAGRFAQLLLRAGVLSGEAVVIPSLRSHDLVSKLLGILWVGGHYVFVDPKLPEKRQSRIVETTGAKVGFDLSKLQVKGVSPVLMTNIADSDQSLPFKPHAHDAAYIKFTSGSTGEPKGVVVPHKAIVRLVVDSDFICFDAPNIFMLHSALSFDAATLELWGPLLNGGLCVICPPEITLTPDNIGANIQETEVTNLWLTSSFFNLLISENPDALQSIKQLLIGGEVLSVRHVRSALAFLPNTSIFNGYGPTENTTFTTVYPIPRELPDDIISIPIGFPITGTECEVFDEFLRPVAQGEEGELLAFGKGVAIGYLGREDLTDERFVEVERANGQVERAYRTGDLVRQAEDGCFEYIGRNDTQVKIEGNRIELGEIEVCLHSFDEVKDARVVLCVGPEGQKRLAAYIIWHRTSRLTPQTLRERLGQYLPAYMQPHFWLAIDAMPLKLNGKLDVKALPDPYAEQQDAPKNVSETLVKECWYRILGRHVVKSLNFLDAGGTSLESIQLKAELARASQQSLSETFVFEYPTIASQEGYFCESNIAVSINREKSFSKEDNADIAVIGMACRVPGANDSESFWNNLVNGEESITFFSDAELDSSIPAAEKQSKHYVPAKGVLQGADFFDAKFFDISPKEADVLDPQQRVMLELSWHALEDAGYAPDGNPLNAGLYMGSDWPRYLRTNISPNQELMNSYGELNASLANERDFLTTRISYKLNLTGPSVNIATACSTGLVAIANAAVALQRGECQLALAGGVSISTPLNAGYRYQEGSMLSADGHTRTFDADATGTTFNDGAGLVVLKRLSEAERDGDHIHGVIKGCAVNNDGSLKASFTAPSIAGQVDVYQRALQNAGIDPNDVGFIETHGTATPLGDPIEVESLQRVYDTGKEGGIPCALGSVKSNIGHTIHASGVAGFIKAVKTVESGKIPGTLHYKKTNTNIKLGNSRLYVNAETVSWPSEKPRFAAVSSLGVGGTNVHVIVQEYIKPMERKKQKQEEPALSRMFPILISAKSAEALELQIESYLDWFKGQSGSTLFSDFSYSNSCLKTYFPYRVGFNASSFDEAIKCLEQSRQTRALFANQNKSTRLGFIFTGQGSQRVNMGADLYSKDENFKAIIDKGIQRLEQLSLDDQELAYLSEFRSVLFFGESNSIVDANMINQTRYSQPALFLFEFALARYMMSAGCSPKFFIGHSIGEWVAATLSGVFSFDDALCLVAYRGCMMQSMRTGAMLSVQCDEDMVEDFCAGGLDLAACNAPGVYVLSGETEMIDAAVVTLKNKDIAYRKLVTSHAFHSSMMDPMIDRFKTKIDQVKKSIPETSRCIIISSVTGTQIANEKLVSSAYWADQVREPVKFSQALQHLSETYQNEFVACVEIGPGDSLVKLLSRHSFARGKAAHVVGLAAQPNFRGGGTGEQDVVATLTQLWCRGSDVVWGHFFAESRQQLTFKKTKLPLYCFNRERHWVDALVTASHEKVIPQAALAENLNIIQQTTVKIVEKPMSAEQHLVEVQNKIRAILEDVSGYDLSDLDPDTHFSEAGLDSLLLTQAALAIEKKYGGDITFRLLADVLPDLGGIANYMAEHIPVEVVAVEESASIQAATSMQSAQSQIQMQPQLSMMPAGSTAQNSEIATLVQSQLQVMQMQLQALSGGQVVHSASPVASAGSVEAPSTIEPDAGKPVDIKGDSSDGNKPISAVTKNAMRMTRISKEIIGTNLTTAQQQWVDSVMQNFQEKFAKSKEITQEHRQYFSDPRSVSGFNPAWKEIVFPMVIEKSKGSKIWDVDGNKFIDIVNGFGPILFGHRPDFIMDAVKAQFESGIETGPQHPLAGEVAKLVCEITKNERCAYANTGSEAMACALRMVRTATGKDTVVMFEGSYHGIFDEMVARPGANHKGMPLAPGIPRSALENVRVLPWGDPESIDVIRSMEDVAAVIVETVQSRNPVIQDANYIKQIRAAADDIDACLIFDEVVTGFRVAAGGIQERFGVRADMVTYGKILGGGFPIGLVAGKAKYLDALDGGYWEFGDDSIPEAGVTFFAGTFLRHPAALAAAKEVLLKIKSEGPKMYQALDAKTERLSTQVNQVIKCLECDITLDHFSSMFYVKVPSNAHWGHLLYKLMLLDGVHIIQNAGSFLTTEHTDEDIDKLIAAFVKSIALLVSNGLIEGNSVEANKILKSQLKQIPAGARLGKNAQGEPAYFIEDPENKGQYIEVGTP